MIKTIIIIIVCAVLRSEGTYIMKHGVPLSPRMLAVATILGIDKPEEIRVLEKSKVFGMKDLAGITIGKAIEIKKGYNTDEVMIHELVHVKQYQEYGGIKGFLKRYVSEILKYGYEDSPLEIQAEYKTQLILEILEEGI